jgi:hypothetical protein
VCALMEWGAIELPGLTSPIRLFEARRS